MSDKEHDREFVMKRAWPSGIFFEDNKDIPKEPYFKLLTRSHSYSDSSSLLGNSSMLCLQSPFAGVS